MTTQDLPEPREQAATSWQAQLERLLDDAIRVVRTAAVDGRQATDQDLRDGLRLISQVAFELRVLNDPESLPF